MGMKKRRRKAWFAALLVLTLLGASSYVLGWSSLLSVKKVVVVGAPNASETFAIQHNFQIGEKMARLESQKVSLALKSYTWLDHASISRNWLKGIVTVRVWTRTPIAQFQSHLVDQNGVVFDLPNIDTTHLPTITGTNATSAKFATDLLSALPPIMRTQISGVLVRGNDWAILTIADPSRNKNLSIVWGDLTETSLKVKVYQALIALPENVKVTYIDVSAPHAPIVK